MEKWIGIVPPTVILDHFVHLVFSFSLSLLLLGLNRILIGKEITKPKVNRSVYFFTREKQ